MSRKLKVATIFLVLLTASFAGIVGPGAPAYANPTTTSLTMPNVAPQDFRVHGDGSFTIADCDNSNSSTTYTAVTSNPQGKSTNNVPKQTSDGWSSNACRDISAVGLDGTYYIAQINRAKSQTRVAAYKNGAVRWAYVVTACYQPADVRHMTVGPNGNIYLVANSPACTKLIGLEASSGKMLFAPQLSVSEPWNTSMVTAMKDEIVVKTGREISFFDYSGRAKPGESVVLPSSSSERIIASPLATRNNDALYVTRASASKAPAACVSFYDVYKFYFKHDSLAPTALAMAACQYITDVEIKPDGKIVYVYQNVTTGEWRLRQRSNSGVVDFDIRIDSLSGASVYTDTLSMSDTMIVSSTGDIYLRRRVKALPENSLSDTNIRIDKVNNTGVSSLVFSTAQLDNPKTKQVFIPMTTDNGGLAGTKLYVPYCLNVCDAYATPRLIVVNVSTGFDYPRSVGIAAHPQLNYVALGDSFSSGEGVEPFYDETNVSPDDEEDEDLQNMCHRSKKGYSEQLNNTPGAGLQLTKFAACSGAETENIFTTGQWNEDKQLDALSANTDFVTITISGNDMDFEQFARACASVGTGAINCSGQPYTQTLAKISNVVAPNIEDTLDAIDSKLSGVSSNAQVLVIGYPQILPETWVSQSSTDCIWLFEDEHYAIRDVIDTLNDTIKDKVETKGGRFAFVPVNGTNSPFNGHGLCQQASQTYFNGPILGQNEKYSFHPNAYGQEAYKTIIMDYMN